MMEHVYSREVKFSSADAGSVSGYGSVFGNVDQGYDRIVPGAFRKSIVGRDRIPMLFEHRDTIGAWHGVAEDQKGLRVDGKISNTALGRDARTLARDGAITGLSIGYKAKDYDYEGDVRVLKEVDVLEISLVTFPMNKLAQVTSAKSALARGDEISRSDLEMLLRQSGLSRRQAKRLLEHGYTGLSAKHSLSDLLENMSARLEID